MAGRTMCAAIGFPTTWGSGAVFHGLRRKHLKAYLDEFTFRFNRRKSRHAAFATLLGIRNRDQTGNLQDVDRTGFNGISDLRPARI